MLISTANDQYVHAKFSTCPPRQRIQMGNRRFSWPHPGKTAAEAKSDVPLMTAERWTILTTVVQKGEVE